MHFPRLRRIFQLLPPRNQTGQAPAVTNSPLKSSTIATISVRPRAIAADVPRFDHTRVSGRRAPAAPAKAAKARAATKNKSTEAPSKSTAPKDQTQTPASTVRPAAAERVSFMKKWSRLLVISLALAIIIIDTTLLNVSLGNIIRDLHTDIESIQWVITAYALTLSALTITGGRLGDLFGRKKMFMLGAVIFAIGSFIASISKSSGVLLAGESIIEGIGAAMMLPAAAALVLSNFYGRDRAIAFGVFGGVAGAASAIGPILGGWLTSNYSWRWGFRINVFVVIVLLLGSFILRETRDTEERPTLDWVGVLLSSTGLLALVFGIIESGDYGWWLAKKTFAVAGHGLGVWQLSITPIALAIGLLLLIAFWNWEKIMEMSHKTPLVSTKLFRNSQFMSGAVVLTLLTLGLTGLIFALPIFFQGVRGLDALHTGLALLPLSITLFFAGPISALLSKWFKPKHIVLVGLALNAIGLIVLRQSLHVDSIARDFIPAFFLFGLGMGFNQAQLSNITLSAVSVQEAGEASGVSNTARQIGSSFGSAIIGAVLLATLTTQLTGGVTKSTIIPEVAKAQIQTSVHEQTANIEFGGGAQSAQQIPAPVRTEIKQISNRATTNAVRTSMTYSIIFAILGFLAAFWLPSIRDVETAQSAAGDKPVALAAPAAH